MSVLVLAPVMNAVLHPAARSAANAREVNSVTTPTAPVVDLGRMVTWCTPPSCSAERNVAERDCGTTGARDEAGRHNDAYLAVESTRNDRGGRGRGVGLDATALFYFIYVLDNCSVQV